MATANAEQIKKYSIAVVLAGYAVAAAAWAANEYGGAGIPEVIPFTARWIGTLGFVGYAIGRRSLTTFILISMIVGASIGHDWPQVGQGARILSLIFLRLIKVIIAPLLFATLVYGIAGHPDLKKVGRLGIKSIVYFEVVTTLALFIGLAAINISKAGTGIVIPENMETGQLQRPAPKSAGDIILHIFPENIAKSVAEGDVLQIVVFRIVFGIALPLVSEKRRQPMLDFCESLAQTMFKFTGIVMMYAPIGVGAAIAYTVGHMGLGILKNLATLLATLYAALICFMLFVLLPVALVARVPLRRFISSIAEPVTIAFATTSSEAALPRAMENMEKLGVPRPVVAFVIPTGYSFNLDGTTLYLSLATVFVAQAAGIPLTFGQQMMICFTLMLTSKGVAGVPRASLVILLATASQFNLPEWPIFIILGIDELMDMARTSVNVVGNCLASAVMARWEGEFNDNPVAAEANSGD